MTLLIDTSVWIDFTRSRSPPALKRLIVPYLLTADAVLADPIIFELLRYANDREVPLLEAQFGTMPILATPADLWSRAAVIGQGCRKAGITPGSLDLLIAAVAVHHDADLLTLDADFEAIAKVTKLRVKLLRRP